MDHILNRATKPTDSKKDEFRKYLEKAGVLDALTKVLVSLYEEPDKPEDALEYIRKYLGDITETSTEADTLKKQIEELQVENRELKKKLIKYEPDEEAE